MPAPRTTPAVFVALAVFALTAQSLTAQRAARTPEGHPDLQGIWLNNTATPLERPREVGGREFFTPEEARAYEERYLIDRTMALTHGDARFEIESAGDLDTYDPGPLLPGNRTSMIVNPADGRVPALTPDAQQRASARAEHIKGHYADNPEDFPNAERCLVVGNASVPPMLPVFYNNNVQIVQTPDYVMILSEMVHDVRLIDMKRRTHLPPVVRLWKGDSIGRWDGDTLVIDTTNFTDKTPLRGSGTALHVVERLSLKDPGTLRYAFTIDDPASFSQAWSGETVMPKTEGPLFEYACHEANYSLSNMLRGARFREQPGPR